MKPYQYSQGQCTMSRYALFKHRGDTLIEVLITFFIISVGILGASSMQIMALQNLNSANYRDQAVIIVDNLAESMRASDAPYDNLITAAQAQAQNLPSGDLTAQPAAVAGDFTITLCWDEDGGDAPCDINNHNITFTP